MSVTAYGLCGFALMLSITLFLVWGKMSPVVGLTIIPLIFGLAIGATPVELGAWALKGMQSQVSTAAMFIFAVIFFSCMMDTGVFDVIISKLLGRAKSVKVRKDDTVIVLGDFGVIWHSLANVYGYVLTERPNIEELDRYIKDHLRHVYTGKWNSRSNYHKVPNETLRRCGYISMAHLFKLYRISKPLYRNEVRMRCA